MLMNVAGGFTQGFIVSWFSEILGQLDVYQGLNAEGPILLSYFLAPSSTGSCEFAYCDMRRESTVFDGLAHSLTFTSTARLSGIDDLALDVNPPGPDLPEPGSGLLMAAGLSGLLVWRWKRNMGRSFAGGLAFALIYGVAVEPASCDSLLLVYQNGRITVNSVSNQSVSSRSETVTPAGTVPYAVRAEPTGRFLYNTNVGSNSVTGYKIAPGELAMVPGTPATVGVAPTFLAPDPTAQFLYVVNTGSNNISAFKINQGNGALSAIPGSPFSAAGVPLSMAIDPTGQFAYVARAGLNSILGYRVNAQTGALTPLPGSPFPAGTIPYWAVIEGTGQFLYVANVGAATISAFRIVKTTGLLQPVPGSPFNHPGAVVGSPFEGLEQPRLAADPLGQYLYSPSAAFRIDPCSGALAFFENLPHSFGPRIFVGSFPQFSLTGEDIFGLRDSGSLFDSLFGVYDFTVSRLGYLRGPVLIVPFSEFTQDKLNDLSVAGPVSIGPPEPGKPVYPPKPSLCRR